MEKVELRRKQQNHKDRVLLSEKGERLVFVIRIRGVNSVPPKPKKVLELFRLLQVRGLFGGLFKINNGVFVRVNASTQKMLEMIAPYVTFGYPTLSTIRSLLYKRGYCRVNNQRIALSSNDLVATALGKYNIICLEDLIHEVYTVGPHFKEVNAFLWPFKLSPPNGGFRNVRRHFNEGGDLGNREYFINGLVAKMI